MKKIFLTVALLIVPGLAYAMEQGQKRTLPDADYQACEISRADRKRRIKERRLNGDTNNQLPMAEEQVPMTDDRIPQQKKTRTLSNTQQGPMQELVSSLERYSGDHNWQQRKELIAKAYQAHTFDLKTLRYQQWNEMHMRIEYNPVMDAAFHEDVEFMEWLLKHGADANAQAAFDAPVLFSVHTYPMAKLLVQHGADVNAVACDGEPLSMVPPFRKYDAELINLYGAQGQASVISNIPGGSPLTLLIDQALTYKSKET